MDDLLLFTPSKDSHFEKLEDLLKALRKNDLKISPKKCQLLKTELQYMGNTIFIRNKRLHVKPLRSRIEAIQKLKPPTKIKECTIFTGMVNFVSIFCPELQGLLKSIYDLMQKVDTLYGKKNSKKHSLKSKVDCKDPQFFICQIGKGDSNYTQIPASLQQVVHCIKFRMVNPSSLPMPAKECWKLPEIILLQN